MVDERDKRIAQRSTVHLTGAPVPQGEGLTVIVLGCGRGGTSAIAGALRILGVAFPDDTHPLKHESSPILYRGQSVDRETTNARLRSMDKRFDVWGWKSPKDVFFVHDWLSLVRNPVFVVVFRNQVETIRIVMKWESLEFEVAARHVLEVYAELGRYIMMSPFPLVVLDYDELRARPDKILRQVAGWLNCPVQQEDLAAACEFVRAGDGRYRTIDRGQACPVEFSPEELANDRATAQAALYGSAAAELVAAAESLSVDTSVAQEVVMAILAGELGDKLKEEPPGDADEPEFGASSDSAPPVTQFLIVRQHFVDALLNRTKLQRQIDRLLLCEAAE